MFDPVSMTAALTSLKSIIYLAKGANNAQLAMHISSEVAQIQERLIDVQQQVLGLQTENQQLRDTVRRMSEIAAFRAAVSFDGKVYWKRDCEKWDGPFCPVCLDDQSKIVRLDHQRSNEGGLLWFWCNVHKINFGTPPRE